MTPWQSQPPAIEPITLAEAKTYLRVDHADEDALIADMITAARRFCEDYTRRALITQEWSWSLGAVPERSARRGVFSARERSIELPRGPVIALLAVNVTDANDAVTPYDLANLVVSPRDARLYLKDGASWPESDRVAGGITFVWQAGYGATAADVPGPIRQAILQLVARLYGDRSLANAEEAAPHTSVSLLLSPYRDLRTSGRI